MTVGLDGDAFWRRTPRLVALELKARSNALDLEHQNRAWLAWHIGVLSGLDGKDFPKSPADLIERKSEAPAEDWRTMERAALAWTVNQGGEVKRG